MSECAGDIAILPVPAEVRRASGTFALEPSTPIVATDSRARATGDLLADLLAPGLGATPRVSDRAPRRTPGISLAIDDALDHLGREGYALAIERAGIAIRARGTAGLFYGVQTLRQLLPVEAFGPVPLGRTIDVPSLTIADAPRHPWRGLMLDPARHFIPPAEILAWIDAMALHKLNVLHLHLTDDQGWRLEIRRYPRLTAIGARRRRTVRGPWRAPQGFDEVPHGGFYTHEDIRRIVAYARARHVRVVPEIDIPGHASAAIAAYPALGVTGEPVEVATTWAGHPHVLSPSRATIRFLEHVLDEVVALFPGRHVHLGGDEAAWDTWRESAAVQARMRTLGLPNERSLQSWLMHRMGGFLAAHGRRMIGWDEIVDERAPPESTVMSWRGWNGGILAARAGHDVIMTPHEHVYLNYYQSHDPGEPLAIGGYTPLAKVYAFDPVPPALEGRSRKRVLGAQAMLWGEFTPTRTVRQHMLFPRMVALAEALWSPPERRHFEDFLRRMSVHERRLDALGIVYRPVAALAHEPRFTPRADPIAGMMPPEPTLV